jgi:hypothetical protein
VEWSLAGKITALVPLIGNRTHVKSPEMDPRLCDTNPAPMPAEFSTREWIHCF